MPFTAGKDIGIGIIGLGMGRHVLQVDHEPSSRMTVTPVCDLDEDRLQ